jgi:small ligand-binding sensory domain FIST
MRTSFFRQRFSFRNDLDLSRHLLKLVREPPLLLQYHRRLCIIRQRQRLRRTRKQSKMDAWNADLLLSVISFLNVADASRLAATASRYYYLVRHYQKLRGPELVAATSHEDPIVESLRGVFLPLCQDAVSSIQSPPNLALSFSTPADLTNTDLPRALPANAVILEAVADSIQSAGVAGRQVECKSRMSVMLASLPQAKIQPFCIRGADIDTSETGEMSELLTQLGTEDWKVFIVYVAGNVDGAETFISRLQATFPEATIVGGFCLLGGISLPVEHVTKDTLMGESVAALSHRNSVLGGKLFKPGVSRLDMADIVYELICTRKYALAQIQQGVFGICLAGQVPFRSVVSRGVKSLIQGGEPQPSTGFFVEAADFVRPGDPAYIFRGDSPPPYHLIRRIRNMQPTGMDRKNSYTPLELVTRFGKPDMIGIRRDDQDGFELKSHHAVSFNINSLVFFCGELDADEPNLVGANLDLYSLDGDVCCADVDRKMQRLKEETSDETILGAIMFSCNGRGPMPGSIIREEMGDAKRFAKVFPGVPCLGFYAYGEIGPMALAGRKSCFQTGNACVQGFTAVFALFIVPKIDMGAFKLNDSTENVRAFLTTELGRSKI